MRKLRHSLKKNAGKRSPAIPIDDGRSCSCLKTCRPKRETIPPLLMTAIYAKPSSQGAISGCNPNSKKLAIASYHSRQPRRGFTCRYNEECVHCGLQTAKKLQVIMFKFWPNGDGLSYGNVFTKGAYAELQRLFRTGQPINLLQGQ
jgi:hypothetical protein